MRRVSSTLRIGERDVKFMLTTTALMAYRVELDGVHIGDVRYIETRYNLRRVLVSRGWLAYAANGAKVARPGRQRGDWESRAHAIIVLWRVHHNQKAEG